MRKPYNAPEFELVGNTTDLVLGNPGGMQPDSANGGETVTSPSESLLLGLDE